MIGGSANLSSCTASRTIDDLCARCEPAELAGLDDRALAALAAGVVQLWPRLEAARLRLLAAVAEREAFRVDGARDAVSWLAWKAAERRGTARREIELATALSAMPAVEAGLADASLSRAQAVELGRAALADADVQQALVASAKGLPVEEVARQVDRWQLEHPTTPIEVQEALRVSSRPGGGKVEATLDTEHLEWVQTAIDTAADTLGLRDLGWEQRRARGLVAVCRYFLDHAKLPMRRQGRPTVVVTVSVETLTASSGGTARLDSGAFVRGDTARRLACDAGIIRMITDPVSMPLDLGRATRVPSPAQARAVIHRDEHCRYEGCTAPPWACEVHHLDHWSRGGPTDLDRLGLLCWHHHTLTHRHQATHHLVDVGNRRLRLEARRRTNQPRAA